MQSEQSETIRFDTEAATKKCLYRRILARAVTWSEDRHETPVAAVKGSKLGAAERPRNRVPPPKKAPAGVFSVTSKLAGSNRDSCCKKFTFFG